MITAPPRTHDQQGNVHGRIKGFIGIPFFLTHHQKPFPVFKPGGGIEVLITVSIGFNKGLNTVVGGWRQGRECGKVGILGIFFHDSDTPRNVSLFVKCQRCSRYRTHRFYQSAPGRPFDQRPGCQWWPGAPRQPYQHLFLRQ